MTDTDGRPLGSQYHLDCLIGRGGMGDVWRGTDVAGNAFAFKLLQPQYVEDGEVVRRFLGERQLLTSVRHPNVVGVHDMVAEGATLAIVMDLIKGTDLRRHLRERGTLAAGEACRITSQIARGLGAIHAKRIVHRDIKPENTLLDQTVSPPQVRITDFGVARLMDDSPAQSRRTALAGTPLYMSPEVINGETPTPRSDLYALGIILYELLCGVTPFAGLATGPMMQAHITMNPGRPAGIDDQLWHLIAQLVSKDPNQRPRDASVVAEQLEYLRGWLAGRPALTPLGSPPPPVPVTPPTAVTTIAGAWVTPTQLAEQLPTLGYPSWPNHPPVQNRTASGGHQPSGLPLDVTMLAGAPAGYHPLGSQPPPPSYPSFQPPPQGPWLSTQGPPGPMLPPPRPYGSSGSRPTRTIVIMMAAVAVLLAAMAVLLTQVLRSQSPVEVVSTPAQSTSAPAQPSPVATRTVIVATTTTAAAPLPVGTWITVLESLPKTEFSLAQAEAKAASLSAVGVPVVVIDSDATPGLNKGFWALGVPGSSSREAAVAQCAAFGRQAGGTCYPRQVG